VKTSDTYFEQAGHDDNGVKDNTAMRSCGLARMVHSVPLTEMQRSLMQSRKIRPTKEERNRCPACDGRGGDYTLIYDQTPVNEPAQRNIIWNNCRLCEGAGLISNELYAAYALVTADWDDDEVPEDEELRQLRSDVQCR